MGRAAKPWYRKGNDCWYCEHDGRQVRLAVGRGNRDEAEWAFHRLKAGVRPAEVETQGAGIQLQGLADRFMEAAENLAADTRANYRRYLRSFVRHAGAARDPAEIRPEDVLAWLDAHPGWGTATRKVCAAIVKAMVGWGVREKILEGNPLAGLKLPKGQPRPLAMTAEMFGRILAAVRGRAFGDFLTLMHETGCRPSEAMRAEAGHVDFDAATITMSSKTSRKTGLPRVIYLSPRAVAIVRELAERHPSGPLLRDSRGNPWSRDSVCSRFYRLRQKLGLPPGWCAETLRHGWITDALEAGVPVATVAALAGHVDTAMVANYSKLRERKEHLKAGLAKVRPGHQS